MAGITRPTTGLGPGKSPWSQLCVPGSAGLQKSSAASTYPGAPSKQPPQNKLQSPVPVLQSWGCSGWLHPRPCPQASAASGEAGCWGTATSCPHTPPGPGHWSGAEPPRVLLSLGTGAGAMLAWLWPQQEQAGGRGHTGLPAQDGGCPSPSTVLCARGDGAPRGRLQSHPAMPLGRIKENYSRAQRHEL